MAKKTIEKYYSDISGDEIGDASASVDFGFEGTAYEIDLTAGERDKLAELLAPYIEVARKKSAGRRSASKSSGGYDAKTVRAWAAENNVEVPARGRIPAAVLEAYNSAK